MEEVPRLDILLGWTVRMRCSVREARHRRSHSAWSVGHVSLEQGKCTETEAAGGCGAGRDWGETAHGRKCRGLGGSDGYPTNVNALKVTKLHTGKREKHPFALCTYLHAERQTGRPGVLWAMCHRVDTT